MKYYHSSKNYLYDSNSDLLMSYPNKFELRIPSASKRIDYKLIVFKDRLQSYFFDPIEKLKTNEFNAISILAISINYIEGIYQYKIGEKSNGKSNKFFVESFKDIFPKYDEDLANQIYTRIRCGLYHEFMMKPNTFVNFKHPGIEIEENRIYIGLNFFLKAIKKDFRVYTKNLSCVRNIELRQNFEKVFKY